MQRVRLGPKDLAKVYPRPCKGLLGSFPEAQQGRSNMSAVGGVAHLPTEHFPLGFTEDSLEILLGPT